MVVVVGGRADAAGALDDEGRMPDEGQPDLTLAHGREVHEGVARGHEAGARLRLGGLGKRRREQGRSGDAPSCGATGKAHGRISKAGRGPV